MDANAAHNQVTHALMRVEMAANALRTKGYHPGYDVSLFRALRELHRVIELERVHENAHDPNRLIGALLFHGLSEHMSWTEIEP